MSTELDVRPTETRIVVPRDVDVSLVVTLSHDGVAPNITLDTVTFSVKTALAASTAVFEIANGPGGHTTPASGVTTFAITPARTATASTRTPTQWFYEIRRTVAGTLQEYVYAYGPFEVVPTL